MTTPGTPEPPQDLNPEDNCAAWIARALKGRGVELVFGLEGGHIQPVWDHVARLGIRIVDVRDERAAVHMAHAYAELSGRLGVAMVTAGPGVTNTVTGVANADLARASVLVLGGCPPGLQANMSPLQGLPHVEILGPVTRYARTVHIAEQAVRELDEAIARATGVPGAPGPAYIEIPTDVLRQRVPAHLVLEEWLRPVPPRRLSPDPGAIEEAVAAIRAARRPVVISGRGARGAGESLRRFLDCIDALYLDTQESRGLLAADHPACVGSVRGAVMAQADLVITLGRKLDYQLGFGSPAVFPEAKFLRIADNADELMDNRRGTPEVLASAAPALDAIVDRLGDDPGQRDDEWCRGLRARHRERAAGAGKTPAPRRAEDGRVHPMAIFDAIRAVAEPDYVAVADGGDILSFARVGLSSRTYLDSGVLGCLGVGVPFAIAAALTRPDRQVISVNGDGAFGINAIEIDTAVRHGAGAVFIVSNNAAWNIERYDQAVNYGGRIVGTTLRHSDYAGLARALGAHGERVEDPDELAGAIRRALDNAPAVVDVVTSQEVFSSDAFKGLGYVPDYQPLSAWDEAERMRRGRG